MKLNEILNKKIDYEVVRADNGVFHTRAEIGGRIINFSAISSDHDDNWEIQFNEKNAKEKQPTYARSGSGKELEVFSMVKDSIMELISRYHPATMYFTADKEHEGDNRANAYERLIKRFKIPGYSYQRQEVPDREGSQGYSDFTIVKD